MICNIKDIEINFAAGQQTLHEAAESLGLSGVETRMFDRFYGLRSFPHQDEETIAGMIRPALERLCERHPELSGQVKHVVHCHTIPTVFPFGDNQVARQVTEIFGPQTEYASYTMSHCATGLSVLDYVSAQLDDDEYAIVLIAEKAFHRWVQLIPDTTIMGEVACAVLLSRNGNQFRITDNVTSRDGSFSLNSGYPEDAEQNSFQDKYFTFTQNHMDYTLQHSGLSWCDIKYLVPHNVNISSWKQIAKNMNLPPDLLFLENVSQYGHCFGADPFINLKTLFESGRLEPGDKVMLMTVGLGATASSAIVECGENI
ncbi:3-oxoacyl-[acyl-carrier-protein] synthase III C-terminal domain-containing protein [Vibrio mangrovi]|uniref:3-oxoacyl-(Acyl carrier protein) synthase III n=1 Tax=Vibrio mangrovi TaxID=474394 RepID=A0A1Y6IX29_9VIBR|nr:3-oxoacyl-[acyl-carrier-protein] synthase III C-terminal domain-containing protein [Vibrio mangrovi]MDW6001385.1 3-oxoacyl-[acyl-carrier-protein] synthase III C-terminal domain-containing protein [Vibrio mangrovi]SMS00593.1 3-oxoacyl-(acyl carrier protein) synthase III [Vibrio mangrovi]